MGEAWALQYNKHLAKPSLLLPVEIIKESMGKRLATRRGGDGGGGGVRSTVNGECTLVPFIL